MLYDDLRPPIDILLVEDNPGDVLLIENALRNSSTNCNVYLAEDGDAAMGFLRQGGIYATSPRPQLILLDLNLPKKDGREVLVEIKADPTLKNIPVIVMTDSSYERDILRSYQQYANCYITKPADLIKYNQTIQSVTNFWLTCAKLPAKTFNGGGSTFSGQPLLLIRSGEH